MGLYGPNGSVGRRFILHYTHVRCMGYTPPSSPCIHLVGCSALATQYPPQQLPPPWICISIHRLTNCSDPSQTNMSARPGQTCSLSFRLPDEHTTSGLLVLRLPLGLPDQHTAARSPEHVQGLHGRPADAGRHRDRHKVTLLPGHQRWQTLGSTFSEDVLGADKAAQSNVRRGAGL